MVDLLHGCLEEACDESAHVVDWAVEEELFDEVMRSESFDQPEAQTDVVLEGAPDGDKVLGQDAPVSRPESHCQEERYDELEGLVLWILLQLESRSTDVLLVVHVWSELNVLEDVVLHSDEVETENGLAQPELLVFANDDILDVR